MLYSGGWDDAVYISDMRVGKFVGVVPGPHICGEAIDLLGNLLIAGSYRNQKNLTLYDLRNPKTALQHLEMDISGGAPMHFSECLNYAASFYHGSKLNTKVLAAGCTGGRNEIKFFEAP